LLRINDKAARSALLARLDENTVEFVNNNDSQIE
jgi:hypothetical protein